MSLGGFTLRDLISRFMAGDRTRNPWREFGYPEIIPTVEYWRRYRRDGIGRRIIRAFPSACWRDMGVPRDEQGNSSVDDSDDYSGFVDAWEELSERLSIRSYMERIDRMTRVGHYGILVLGFADGADLSDPFEGQAELAYLAPYPETMVTISAWETDTTSPRFGKPRLYTVQTQRIEGNIRDVAPTRSFVVHHSRVIHVVEDEDDSEVFGTPALESTWNYLLDLEKVSGSAAETFWLNSRGGMVISADPESEFQPDDVEQIQQQVREYENQLRRVIALKGAKITELSPTPQSPRPNMEGLQALIAGATGIPQRILFGSERGELASSQDENSWAARVDERRQQHCGPRILEPFVRRMIETGNLPAPTGDWWIEWPEASAMSPEQEAEVANKRASALATYANSMAPEIVPPQEFRPWIGLPPEPEGDNLLREPDDADDLDPESDDA
jgi:uncharacterized protein